jgi:Delta6-protoilludene synthase
MCSYRKELLSNDADYNAVTIIMHNHHTDVAGGIKWISDLHDEVVEHFLELREQVLELRDFPSFGRTIDLQIAKYIDGLGMLLSAYMNRDDTDAAC